ncbi:MAG: tetratricopeptide repeat protein, partial [Thermodesulfovibrionales bacterium]
MTGKELFEQAQALLVEGKDEESARKFTEAIEAGHDPYMCHLSRGVARLKMKDAGEAAKDFTRAIELHAESSRPYYYRGMVNLMEEHFDLAVEDFSHAMKLKPPMPVAEFSRAVAYARMGNYDE